MTTGCGLECKEPRISSLSQVTKELGLTYRNLAGLPSSLVSRADVRYIVPNIGLCRALFPSKPRSYVGREYNSRQVRAHPIL